MIIDKSEDQLRLAAGISVNHVFARLSVDHPRDSEYFGYVCEFVNTVLVLGLLIRFKSEADLRDMLKIYLETTATPDMIDEVWAQAQAGIFADGGGAA